MRSNLFMLLFFTKNLAVRVNLVRSSIGHKFCIGFDFIDNLTAFLKKVYQYLVIMFRQQIGLE